MTPRLRPLAVLSLAAFAALPLVPAAADDDVAPAAATTPSLGSFPAASEAAADLGTVAPTTDQLVVTFKAGTSTAAQQSALKSADSASPTESSRVVKATAGAAEVVKNSTELDATQQQQAVAALEKNPAVESAEPDRIILRGLTSTSYGSRPNDPGLGKQWHLNAIEAPGAWATASGRGTTIGLLETGYTDHPDLRGKWVPGVGYDFVSANNGGDGNGRDADPTDEGEPGQPAGKWHGTHVAGIAAAATNNGQGVAGVAPDARLSMIRVMGQSGGGYESDHADAIRWGAGLHVNGVPDNPHPSQVLNFSEGVLTQCSSVLRNAVAEAKSRNVAVVASAGNNGVDASRSMPANCGNTIVVGASTPSSSRVSWSNNGGLVDVYAPGTDIYSTWNNGTCTGWGNCRRGSASYGYDEGTSMAAPMVTATIAMMKELNPGLTVEQARTALKTTATQGNGIRILDARRAVEAAPLGGAIGVYYRSHGGSSRFGHPTGGELTGLRNGGAVMEFSTGRAIYWSPATGAQEVNWRGDIGQTFRKTGYENGYGYPAGPEGAAGQGGAYQYFRDPSTHALNLFLWSPETGTHVVHESWGIGQEWVSQGRETGVGYPSGPETSTTGGSYQFFRQRSTGRVSLVLWSPGGGAHLIKEYGAIGQAWIRAGRETGLGFPTSDEHRAADGKVVQTFSSGATISWDPATGATTTSR